MTTRKRSAATTQTPTLDLPTLRRLYTDEGLTDRQIGERHGVTAKAIHARRMRAGIASRRRGTYDRGTTPAHDTVPAVHLDDPVPMPPPGKRKQQKRRKRPFLRLSEVERRIVQRSVDSFLVWCQQLCPICKHEHPPEHPHAPTPYFKTTFRRKHGRLPVWRDLLKTCPDRVRAFWVEELSAAGVGVDDLAEMVVRKEGVR